MVLAKVKPLIGQRIYTANHILEMADPRYKIQKRSFSSTTFGYTYPCIPYGVLNTILLHPNQKQYRVMDWGPGVDIRDGGGGTPEPLEITGHFLARGKEAEVECYDQNQNIKLANRLSSTFSGVEPLAQVAAGFGVETEKYFHLRHFLTKDIPQEKLGGISFHQHDIKRIEEVSAEPYDLIFIMNIFHYFSNLRPELKDNILYHALRLLKPYGLLLFNDYDDHPGDDWKRNFTARINDLPGLYSWKIRFGEGDECEALCVLNGEFPHRWKSYYSTWWHYWPEQLGSNMDKDALQNDYRRFDKHLESR